MRQERDSLGELQIEGNAYYGIGTARVMEALSATGPEFPVEIAESVVRIRAAQAIDFRRSGLWPEQLGAVVEGVTGRVLADKQLLKSHLLSFFSFQSFHHNIQL